MSREYSVTPEEYFHEDIPHGEVGPQEVGRISIDSHVDTVYYHGSFPMRDSQQIRGMTGIETVRREFTLEHKMGKIAQESPSSDNTLLMFPEPLNTTGEEVIIAAEVAAGDH